MDYFGNGMFFLNRFASKSNSFLVFLVQENVSYLYIKVPGQEKKKTKKTNSVKIQGDNKVL